MAQNAAQGVSGEEIWLDGKFVKWSDANIHILTHTLHYGLGVFEGIRCYAGADGRSAVFRLSEHIRRLFDSANARVVFEASIAGITGLHIHPRDIGGAILSVDQTDDWDEWPWPRPTWRQHRATDVVRDIAGVEIQAEDPRAMSGRWAQVLGRAAKNNAIALDDGNIRFVAPADVRGEGGAAIEFTGDAPASVPVTNPSRKSASR